MAIMVKMLERLVFVTFVPCHANLLEHFFTLMAITGVNNSVIFYHNVPIMAVSNCLDFKFSGRLEDVYTVKI